MYFNCNIHTLQEIMSYSNVFSTQQRVEIPKSTIVEIDFALVVIARKRMVWQQFHWQFHPTTCSMVYRTWLMHFHYAFPFIIRVRSNSFVHWYFNYFKNKNIIIIHIFQTYDLYTIVVWSTYGQCTINIWSTYDM